MAADFSIARIANRIQGLPDRHALGIGRLQLVRQRRPRTAGQHTLGASGIGRGQQQAVGFIQGLALGIGLGVGRQHFLA